MAYTIYFSMWYECRDPIGTEVKLKAEQLSGRLLSAQCYNSSSFHILQMKLDGNTELF